MLFHKKKETNPITTELLASGLFVNLTPIGSDNPNLAVTEENELYKKANARDGSVLFSFHQITVTRGSCQISVLKNGDMIAVRKNGLGLFVQLVGTDIVFANALLHYLELHESEIANLEHPDYYKKSYDGRHHYFHLNGHHFGAVNIRYTDLNHLSYEPLEGEVLLMQYENTLIHFYADIVNIFEQYGYLKWVYTSITKGSPYECGRYN